MLRCRFPLGLCHGKVNNKRWPGRRPKGTRRLIIPRPGLRQSLRSWFSAPRWLSDSRESNRNEMCGYIAFKRRHLPPRPLHAHSSGQRTGPGPVSAAQLCAVSSQATVQCSFARPPSRGRTRCGRGRHDWCHFRKCWSRRCDRRHRWWRCRCGAACDRALLWCLLLASIRRIGCLAAPEDGSRFVTTNAPG